MADATINIELKGISQIRAELKALKGELANATDPQQMAELAAKAGELSDKLKDANEKVAVFAAGSPFERTNNALGLMGSQLASLDFEGASESAKSFAVAAKGINGEQIATQLRGLGGVVTNLGKGFMSLGATLLTNPIFLIAGAIAGIVAIIGVLLNKLGFLKPILNAIGDAFRFIGQVIDGVVQSIKDFLDWMGLTAFAAEDAAKKQVKSLEKVDAARENQINKVTKQYDLQIRLAQIDGKNTTDIERQKQYAILETAQARYKSTLEQIEQMKLTGEADAEEIKKLREKAKALRETAQNARNEIKIINAQEVADRRKALEEKQKAEDEAAKKSAEERAKRREERKKEELEFQAWLKEQAASLESIDIAVDLNPQLLPPPDLVQDQADALVPIVEETFSNFDKLRFAFSENFAQSFDGTLGAADSMFKGMGALAEAFAGSSEESARKAFNIQKAANIAQATMDTYKGAVGAFTQAVSTYPAPLGQIIGGVQAASVVAMGIANIKKIASQQFGQSGGNVSATTGGGSTSATSMAQPNVQLFGQNNNANNLSAPTSMEQGGQNITVTAVVSETEVTNTQNKIKKIQQVASL